MITINTCEVTAYSPLIPAIKGMYQAKPGETIELIMNQPQAFKEMKVFLSEQKIGFREIYDGKSMTLQFTVK